MMKRFKPYKAGALIENTSEDFERAYRMDRYKIGKEAVYIPRMFFGWKYIPRAELEGSVYKDESCTFVS